MKGSHNMDKNIISEVLHYINKLDYLKADFLIKTKYRANSKMHEEELVKWFAEVATTSYEFTNYVDKVINEVTDEN